jgi:hypothetical protein
MSQRAVEHVLGRLVTDEGFRASFFENPGLASLKIGAALSPEEIDALTAIPRLALADLAKKLDGRICRLHVGPLPIATEYSP